MAGINFKAFDLGGHEIARRVWKDYYAKASTSELKQPSGPWTFVMKEYLAARIWELAI